MTNEQNEINARRVVTESRIVLLRRAMIALVTIGACLAASLPASADDRIGGRQSVSQPSAEDLRLSAMKIQSATAYYASKQAGNSIASFDVQIADLERRLNGGSLVANGYTLRGAPAVSSRVAATSSSPQTADSLYATLHLSPDYQTQSTQYWCGPATAWNVMTWLGLGNSWRGETLTQEHLANSNWLNTTTAGTNLGDDPWIKTLNGWTNGGSGGWYLISWAPSASTITVGLTDDIDHSFLAVYDVYMSAGTGKLPGYSGYSEVWHYLAGTGYTNYGNNTDWLDPFTGGSPGFNYDYPVTNLVPMMASLGMIW
jgi:hypothetical protein